MLDDSKFRRFATLVLGERLSSERIQAPRSNISLELAIPRLPVVLDKPSAEGREFFRRELLNFTLDRFDVGHGSRNGSPSPVIPSAQQPSAQTLEPHALL